MTYYDEQLNNLQQQVTRKLHLEKILKELQSQKVELEQKAADLEKKKLREQMDVDRLEGHSLAALIYDMMGKKEEKLDKEKQEAYAAAAKYEVAMQELEAVAADLENCERELQSLWGCETCYTQVLKQKAEEIKASGVAEAVQLLQMEEQMTKLEEQKKEIAEAISAGNLARSTVQEVLEKLTDAEGWGTWDLFGGGWVSDIAKHSALDTAQQLVSQLQSELRRFKTELTDISISADLKVSVDGFLMFADFAFDGFFSDWAVLDHINESQAKVQSTKEQIEAVLDQLNGMLAETEEQCARMKAELDEVIVKARV